MPSHRSAALVLAALTCASVTGRARRAAADEYDDGRSDDTRREHVLFMSGMVVGYGVSEFLLKPQLAPRTCRWCEPLDFDVEARDAMVWRHPRRAQIMSDTSAFVVIPAATVGYTLLTRWDEHGSSAGFDDASVVIESGLAAGVINQAVKFGVGRRRPFVHFRKDQAPHLVDDDVSFYSGHTTLSFALAVSAGVVASARDRPEAPLVWGGGLAFATITGYLRIAGDKHYLSDVLVGAAVGIGCGLAVPYLLHDDILSHDDAATARRAPRGVDARPIMLNWATAF